MGFEYIEPADYFPEELRRKYKLGEYWELGFEQAKAIAFDIAEENGRVIDKIIEYSDAFVFCDTTSTLVGDMFPFAIMKKDERYVPYVEYIDATSGNMEELNVWYLGGGNEV